MIQNAKIYANRLTNIYKLVYSGLISKSYLTNFINKIAKTDNLNLIIAFVNTIDL